MIPYNLYLYSRSVSCYLLSICLSARSAQSKNIFLNPLTKFAPCIILKIKKTKVQTKNMTEKFNEVTLFVDSSKRFTRASQFGIPLVKVIKTHEAFNSLWRCCFISNSLPIATNEDGDFLSIGDLIARVMDGYEIYVSLEPQKMTIPPVYVKCTEGRQPEDCEWSEVTDLNEEVKTIRKELKELEKDNK